MIKDSKKRFETTVYFLFSLSVTLAGFGFLLFQVYLYFKTGHWVSPSIINGLVSLGVEWAKYPNDWYGIWKILDKLPLWMSFCFVGFLLLNNCESNRKNIEFIEALKETTTKPSKEVEPTREANPWSDA